MAKIKHGAPEVPSPLRVFMVFESTGWFNTTSEQKETELLPKLKEIVDEWKNDDDIELLGTFDRDILTAGESGPVNWHACFLFNIKDLQTVTEMTHAFRDAGLDRYFRLEASIGRPFFLLEDN